MAFKKIDNKTLRQKVYEQLKEKMISAEILPGEQISLRELAAKLGVSLMPVREALWQLEAERIVVIESNRKMWVNRLSPKDIEEILRIRLKLETMAVEMACDLRPNSVLRKIRSLLSDIHAAVEIPNEYLRTNREFHFIIYSLAESPILFDLIRGLWTRIGPYISLVTRERKDIITSMDFHDAMYEGLAERDKGKISKAISDDLTTAAKVIIRLLEAFSGSFQGEQGIIKHQ